MTCEAMNLCLRLLKESNRRRFDSYSVRSSLLIISRIPFRDCRVHIFPTTSLGIVVYKNHIACNSRMRRKPMVKLSTSVGYHHSASVDRLHLMSDDVENCLPSLHQCSVFRVFETALWKRKKSKEGFEVTHGNRTQNLLHERRALTDCTNPFPPLYF